MAKYVGRVLPGIARPVIETDVELPRHQLHGIHRFLMDTGAPETILNARRLGLDAKTLGPRDAGGVTGIGDKNLPAWIIDDIILRLTAENGMITDITPSVVLAINDEKAPHILGCDALVEHRMRLVFEPAKPEFYLRR